MKTTSLSRSIPAFALFSVAGLATAAFANPTYSTIALSGVSNQYGPGLGAGVSFSNGGFNATPVISNSGNVAFGGATSQAGLPAGMWVFGGGLNYQVATSGGTRPGGGTYPTGSIGSSPFNQMAVNDNGTWFMRQGASTGAFSSAGGSPGRLILAGDLAPGASGATFSAVSTGQPLYNNNDQAAIITTLTGTGVTVTSPNNNASALYIGTPGAMNIALRSNSTSTLLDNGQTANESRVGTFQNASTGFNNNGAYVMNVNLQGANIVTGNGAGSNSAAILSNRNGSLEVIARGGSAAPDATGAPSADLFRGTLNGASAIAFNNAGNVAFTSPLRNAAGTQTATFALFSDNVGGQLRLVGRNTGTVGTVYNPNGSVNAITGSTWSSFSNPILNSQGTLAFNASVTGNQNAIITLDAANRMTAIVRTGDVAVVGGQPLTGLDAHFNTFNSIQMNAVGQMVFSTTLVNEGGIIGGQGSAGGSNNCIFGYDPSAGLMLIARVGDLFQVAPGDFRTIDTLGGVSTTGGQDGRGVGLNNSGQFVFQLNFVGGSSGVFVATIPAPSAAGLLALSGLVAARRRR